MPQPRNRRSRRTSIVLISSAATALTLAVPAAAASMGASTGVTRQEAASPAAPAGAVTIKRDGYGIPHVYAATTRDLFRGYGFAVAQDRLFQMEMSRRATTGTVCEVLGSAYLALDKDSRTGFDPAAIKAQIARLPQADRDILDGYAAGMNEYLDRIIADPDRLMPKQFLDYGFQPSRWTGYDVAMIWVGTMANRYSDSSAEIQNYGVLQQLIDANGAAAGARLFDQIQWQQDPAAPTTVPRRARTARGANTAAIAALTPQAAGFSDARPAAAALAGEAAPSASNIWITGASRTKGAASMLLNGPQFQWFNPSYVYGVGLHGAGFDLAGNTPFAYPAVIFGTNRSISWGSTAGPMNVVDMYQERLEPANPRRYLFRGSYRDMTLRTETIKVKGAADVTLDVLSTRHGVVTSVDPAKNTAYAKKRSWSGREIASLIAWVTMTKARSWNQYAAQAARFAISINWYYADKRGNIGYISPGLLPRRPANQDVRLPATGDGSMEWRGYLPFAANPKVYNPRQGYLANWNNQAAAGFNNDYGNWSVVDRVQEIISQLDRGGRLTPSQLSDLNERASFQDLNHRYLAPLLRAAARSLPAGDALRRDILLLGGWDGQTRDRDGNGSYDGPQPAMMRAWLPILFQTVLADDLPPAVYQSYVTNIYQLPVDQRSIRPAPALKLVYNALLGRAASVPQTVDFLDGRTPQAVLLESFRRAMTALRTERWADPASWSVPISRLQFSHKNFLGVPQASDTETLTGPIYMNRGTENHLAVLSPTRASLCIAAPPGQSGFVAPSGQRSPHYDDQMDLYATFRCRQEHLTRAAVNLNTESVTTLP
ncbi:MAG TPA: penicillin acylase family protein [Dermatophilaceae bacterium]|nr:penicillin acylase family protein [Dermatophilaceae bacterium]